MQPGFPFLFHQRLHCGFALQQYLDTGIKRSAIIWRFICHGCSLNTIDAKCLLKIIWMYLFALGMIVITREPVPFNFSVSASVDQRSVVVFQPHSEWGPLTLSWRHWENTPLHSYTTDHSERSFRLSAGGGPPSVPCGRWRGLECEQRLSSALITPDNRGTMGQMTADKLSRVKWPGEGRRE